jgi:hypothetical protein
MRFQCAVAGEGRVHEQIFGAALGGRVEESLNLCGEVKIAEF